MSTEFDSTNAILNRIYTSENTNIRMQFEKSIAFGIIKRIRAVGTLAILSSILAFVSKTALSILGPKLPSLRLVRIGSALFLGSVLFFTLLFICGIMFKKSTNESDIEKAKPQLDTLKVISLLLVIYFSYSAVMAFIACLPNDIQPVFNPFGLIEFTYNCLLLIAAVLIFYSANAISKKKHEKFLLITGLLIVLWIFLAIFFTILLVASAQFMGIPVFLVLIFLVIYSIMILIATGKIDASRPIEKSYGSGKIVKGAIVGAFIAGPVGAFVGALTQKNKIDVENNQAIIDAINKQNKTINI